VLILGPGVWRLVRQLTAERRQRIRSEERAVVAAHLHDSVLQSLAMIQRAGTAEEMATLARAQERELRAWLYGPGPLPGGTLRGSMEELAGRVEAMHHVEVEVVQVGDARVDERLQALVQAAGEAMTNAARHSGARRVDVYAEVEPAQVTAFVRDRGKGFDPDVVDEDRRGIAESIRGRMERAGGTAVVTSAPGEGTEVELRLPRPAP
jgi:signal transduction histidine kinase